MLEQFLEPLLTPLFNRWPGLVDYSWQVAATVVVALVWILTVGFNWITGRLIKRLSKKAPVWDELFLKSIRTPLRLLIWVIGLSLLLEIFSRNGLPVSTEFGAGLRRFGAILLVAWGVLRFITTAETYFTTPVKGRRQVDRTTADAVAKLLRLVVAVLAGLTLLQSAGVSISGILAFGGIGGIAVGFAAKDLLANFFGGLMVYMDRPFRVGDWIRSPDKDIEGTVEHIGWRLTRIRTFDQRPLYVPNATFANISVENPSRMRNRRIYEHVGVRYDDAAKVKQIVDDVRSMLQAHPEIDTRQTLIVHLNRFGPSSLDFMVYTFTKTTQWVKYHQVKEDVMLRIADIIFSHGAEFAFPTQTVHLEGLEGPEPAPALVSSVSSQ
ncbi:mechanosensitive ion channel family protein [Marinobacterium sediminicola]|uniref:MscS family membrane protein n=1 Tax=Marinobacterium sediminicola TaxID=518898 RepID=A0ABY1RX96_9GAMM|nr:mechanosensitive ion channel family protein [Marinobacterium sediminicola]ULG67861.1 mechanosensitive ion channel family protein [Marinobacterium sediminicola]SMR71438.1 MscS family membrane protein [Marinobacterium sediminicola]